MDATKLRLTIVASNECIAVAVGNYSIDVLLRLLKGDVHITVKA